MAKSKDPEKGKALDVAKKNFEGFAKKASLVKDTEFVSTGDFYLDLAIAHGISPDDPNFNPEVHTDGGMPMGRVVEISGGEGCGKSSECYRVVRNAQQKGLRCLWIDAEHSFSPGLAKIYGVDMEALDVADLIDEENPEHVYSAEEIFDRINNACELGYKVIVLDSVANLMTEAETENDLSEGGVGMGGVAGVLSKALKKTINYAAKNGTLVLLINQLREKIGITFGNNEYTPGGRSLRHNSSLRIKMMKQTNKDEGPIYMETEEGPILIGNWSFVYIMKNRHGKPVNSTIKIPMYYEPYFPEPDEIIYKEAFRLKLIRKHLSTRTWISGEIKGEGMTGLIAAIKAAGKMEAFVEEIKQVAKDTKAVLPPEVLKYKASEKLAEVPKDADANEAKVSRRRKAKDSPSSSGEPVES